MTTPAPSKTSSAPDVVPALDPLDCLLKPKEAARWLRMSESDFKKKGRAGTIPVCKIGRRQVLAHPRIILAKLADDAGVKPEIIAAAFTLPRP